MKSNFTTRRFWPRHQLPNRFDDRCDVLVVYADALFQFGKSARKLAIGLRRLAQLHKRAHDGNVDLDRALAVQHARQHRYTLFCERVRQMSCPPQLEITICDFKSLSSS